MNTTLTRIAMALPIVAALLALTSGWDAAQAQPGPNFPNDSVSSDTVVVDPAPPKPPKWQDVPVIDPGDIVIDPGPADPAPPADPPADPAPSDDSDDHSDHDDDSDHDDHGSGHGTSTGGTTSRPAVVTTSVPAADTDTEFQATDTKNASESISPNYLQNTGAQIPTGVVLGLGALLMAVIGWAAYRHHRVSQTI